MLSPLESMTREATSSCMPLPAELRKSSEAKFLNLVKPLLDHGYRRLRLGISHLATHFECIPFSEATASLMVGKLPGQCLWMISRVLILELNIMRVSGRLRGSSSAERLADFLTRLNEPMFTEELFDRYPVLKNKLDTLLDQWVCSRLEFLERLGRDWQMLIVRFAGDKDPGPLIEVIDGLGDRHRKGRTVLIAGFQSGLRLVYKPKPLAVDARFQDILHTINVSGDFLEFKTLQILERGHYGWMEHVAVSPCSSQAELARFYRRQGGYLALLYLLYGTDVHYENLIAAGEHPVLVDLETLFHPHTGTVGDDDRLMPGHTVASTGMLPQFIKGEGDLPSVDISGLGYTDGQTFPTLLPAFHDQGTDHLRIINKPATMQTGHHAPRLQAMSVPVWKFAEEIVSGFIQIASFFRAHRQDLLGDRGPIAAFAKAPVRAIFRPTHEYVRLLNDGLHPDFLQSETDAERLLGCLKGSRDQEVIIAAELDALRMGDVPLFTTLPDRRDLCYGSGQKRTDFFDETPLTLVRKRLEALTDNDVALQTWIIRGTLFANEPVFQRRSRHDRPATDVLVTSRELHEAARSIGDRLALLAIESPDEASWLHLYRNGKDAWDLAEVDGDLYGGLAGIALFLAYLGQTLSEDRYTVLSRKAVRRLEWMLEQETPMSREIGAFTGLGGVIYAYTHLGVLWNKPKLLDRAEALAQQLDPLVERDSRLDILGGVAGCLVCLKVLWSQRPSNEILEIAIRCGERLLAHAQPMAVGWGWFSDVSGSQPLAGFAHGAAGIAWSLIHLANMTKASRFRKAALQGLAYERSLFCPEQNNWPDLRPEEGSTMGETPRFGHAWCYGAPGIGLSRLSIPEWRDRESARTEIAAALESTLAGGFGKNHSLCHGDLAGQRGGGIGGAAADKERTATGRTSA